MNLTPEEKDIGKDNYHEAVGFTRRDLLKGVVAAGAATGAGLGAHYFLYDVIRDPLRVAVIGTGDEGSVLIGALNPKYIEVAAICDIRPYNVHRAFHGDWSSDTAIAVRPGLMTKYGWVSEDQARQNVKVYESIDDTLNDPKVEAIIIALPLHLHAPVAAKALLKGKHVLTEKLMAHNVAQCKVMTRIAEDQKKVLAVGHQRHYSVLYDNAVNLIQWGLLGELNHIRAQWHRGNLPGADSWQMPIPGGEDGFEVTKDGDIKPRKYDKITDELKKFTKALEQAEAAGDVDTADLLKRKIKQWQAWDLDKGVDAKKFDYRDFDLGDGRVRKALEELVRWRLFERTGGGLMAELGSHQLDASTIFCSAVRRDGKKAHPLSVHAVGGRHTFARDRDAEDHVYCMYEFPAPGYEPTFDVGYYDRSMNFPPKGKGVPSYDEDPNRKIVVTYSSINGNGFGGYGEVVMGTKGTIVLEREQEVMLYKDSATSTKVGVGKDKGGPTLDTQASGKGLAAVSKTAAAAGPVSRGYTEEIEHWAWCIRNQEPGDKDSPKPRCNGHIALGDAVIALATNVAIRNANKGAGGYLKFEETWYDVNNDATPDGSSTEAEMKSLTGNA